VRTALRRARAGVGAQEMGEGLKREVCARARQGRAASGPRARVAATRALRSHGSPTPTPPTFSTRGASKPRGKLTKKRTNNGATSPGFSHNRQPVTTQKRS
jgi:hypothetical protein